MEPVLTTGAFEGSAWTMVDITDLYALLQVDPAAEFEVIRAAYRALAAKNHPDVGGSADRMAQLNIAWTVLADPATRAGYDRQRRLRDGGDRWDAYATGVPNPIGHDVGRILEFGRFAGWSIPEVARHDPDYLEWLIRTPNGRRYQSEIDQVLGRSRTLAASPPIALRQRRGLRWR